MTTPSGPVQNRPQEKSGPPGPAEPPKRGGIRFPRWLGWAIFLGLLAWNGLYLLLPPGGSSADL
ncbi:MAG TPA: hypothetical protein VNF73_17230, partial [Candidatus Saccharimonadales bacterium]|nr:hypothetical protein [Candidatus Saccharimonadales bacterium]